MKWALKHLKNDLKYWNGQAFENNQTLMWSHHIETDGSSWSSMKLKPFDFLLGARSLFHERSFLLRQQCCLPQERQTAWERFNIFWNGMEVSSLKHINFFWIGLFLGNSLILYPLLENSPNDTTILGGHDGGSNLLIRPSQRLNHRRTIKWGFAEEDLLLHFSKVKWPYLGY